MTYRTIFFSSLLAFSTFFNQGHAFICGLPMFCLQPLPTYSKPEAGKAFITVGGGYSWSTHADITANPADWDVATQGYDNDVKNSEFYTFALGYHTCSIFSFSVEVDYRPNYCYKKYQTSSATSTPGFTPAKTRHFNLTSTTYTFNAFLNKEGNYCNWSFRNCFSIAPFVGGGLGASYNTLYDFHSVLPYVSGSPQEVRSIMNNKQKTSFAGQFTIGFTTKLNCRLNIDIGYRWFYGGKFETNNYITNVDSSTPTDLPPHIVSPWKGKLRANELYINLNYNL
jgi:opacity protein-like surface antigen